jgi:hypothetical protein
LETQGVQIEFNHVKGHQDTNKILNSKARLNHIAHDLATSTLNRIQPKLVLSSGLRAQLTIEKSGDKATLTGTT